MITVSVCFSKIGLFRSLTVQLYGDKRSSFFYSALENFISILLVCCLTNNDDIVHGLEDDGEDEGDDGGQVHHVHPVPHELHLHRAKTEKLGQ
jgi:hypothetical protein